MNWTFTLPILIFISLFYTNTSLPENEFVRLNGGELILSCEADNDGVNWFLNDAAAPRESSLAGSKGSIINSTYVITELSANDTGVYECRSAKTSVAIKNFTVTIISVTGNNSSLPTENNSTELTCNVDTDFAITSLHWRRNEDIINGTSDEYSVSTPTNKHSTLTLNKPGPEDAGLYTCAFTAEIDGEMKEFKRHFSVNTAPVVAEIEKPRSKLEGDDVKIECKVSGFPTPNIVWFRRLENEEEAQEIKFDDRVKTLDNEGSVPNAILQLKKLKIKTDRGDYICEATNDLGSSNSTVTLKVKDKLAAVWPFLGICAEVAILCSIIFIFEKRRNRKMEEEEEVDAVKQDVLNQANGTDDKEVRQRNNTNVKA